VKEIMNADFSGEPSAEELAVEEEMWEASYLARCDEFRALAREALRELDAGETLEVVVEDDKIRFR
jgi:hypothetical protein